VVGLVAVPTPRKHLQGGKKRTPNGGERKQACTAYKKPLLFDTFAEAFIFDMYSNVG